MTTVNSSGTYYAYVDEPSSGVGSSYHLSVSVIPLETPAGICYRNGIEFSPPKPIADNDSTIASITIPPGYGNIADLDISIKLTHTNMPDLDVTLTAPDGTVVGLFNDIGSSAFPNMNLVLDDEAAIPFAFPVVSGVHVQPEYSARLSWFDGEASGGTWTLTLVDDTATNTGTLTNWNITYCLPVPLPVCQKGFTPKVVFSTNFEADNGGFGSAGTAAEWEWGTPSFAPITTCASGTKCWKTDLDNTYDLSSNQNLTSPSIDLTHYAAPITLKWSQKFQMESANFDHASVNIYKETNVIAFAKTLWEWMDATMTTQIGAATIQESAGWGAYTRDISEFAGNKIRVVYHLDSDNSINLSGLAVDDVTVTACVPNIYLPAIFRTP